MICINYASAKWRNAARAQARLLLRDSTLACGAQGQKRKMQPSRPVGCIGIRDTEFLLTGVASYLLC